MNRPFAFLGFSCLAGAVTAFFLGEVLSLVYLALALLALFLFRKKGGRELLLSVLGFFLGVLCALGVGHLTQAQRALYVGQRVTIEGVLLETQGKSTLVQITRVGDAAVSPFQVQLYTGAGLRYLPYDKLVAEVEFFDNTEEKRQVQQKLAAGILLTGKILGQPLCIPESQRPPQYRVTQIRVALERSLDRLFSGDRADLLAAMLLGNRDRLGSEVVRDFRTAGVTHILVISGMHMAILAGAALLALRRLPIPRRAALLLVIPILLLYMGIAGFGRSVVRSGVMYLVLILAEVMGEENDSLNALGLAVLLICLQSPYGAVDVGFLLSVSATAGVISLSGPIAAGLKLGKGKVARALKAAFSVSLAAFLCITPVLLLFFGTINFLSIPMGLVLSLPASLFLLCGLGAVLVGLLLPPLAAPLCIVTARLSDLLCGITAGTREWAALSPVYTKQKAALLFIGILLVVAILVLARPRRYQRVVALFVCVGMLLVASLPLQGDTVRLVVEERYGQAVVSLVKGREAVVLYAGAPSRHLRSLGVDTITTLHVGSNEELLPALALGAEIPVKERLFSATVAAVGDTVYQQRHRIEPFPGVYVQLEVGGKMAEITLLGKKILVLVAPVAGRELHCDLAVVVGKRAKVNSSFTILTAGDIIDMKTQGKYFPGGEISVSFRPNGDMRVRRLR